MVIDCNVAGEKPINAAGNITTDGVEVLGRMVRSRGTQDNSAPVRPRGKEGEERVEFWACVT